MPRVAILISGRGSNMVALAQAAQNGVLAGRCEIAAVISSRPAAPGLERARELGFQTFALDARQLSKEAYDGARQTPRKKRGFLLRKTPGPA